MIDDAEQQWAPPTDPVFDLVPPLCEEHISSIYVQLGSPGVNFHSFWDVYNQVRDAVDSDFLFQSSIGVPDEENEPEDSELDARQGPPGLQHLQSCEFGKDGIPPMRHEGKTDLVMCFLPTLFLIYCFPQRNQNILPGSVRGLQVQSSQTQFPHVLILFFGR